MRVLIFSSPDVTMSTATRCKSVAEALHHASHKVGIMCVKNMRKWFIKNGASIFDHPVPEFEPILTDGIIPVENLAKFVSLIGLATPRYIEDAIAAEINAIDDFKPDIIFSDFNLTSPISAGHCKIPLVSTANTPFSPTFNSPIFPSIDGNIGERIADIYNKFLISYHLDPIEVIEELYYDRSDLKIVPSCKELEPLMEKVTGAHYVGSLLSNNFEKKEIPDWMDSYKKGDNIIFVYLSVSDITPTEIKKVIPRTFDNTEFDVVVSFGYHPSVSDLPRPSSNIRFEQFVPGSAMLERSKIFIFHGGQNTTINALMNEVSCIVFPCLIFERDFNARMIEANDIGLRMSQKQFNPIAILEASRELASTKFDPKGQKIARSLRALGGARKVVDLMEKFLI